MHGIMDVIKLRFGANLVMKARSRCVHNYAFKLDLGGQAKGTL